MTRPALRARENTVQASGVPCGFGPGALKNERMPLRERNAIILEPGAADPDGIWDFVQANPDEYWVVHRLECIWITE